MTIPSRACAWLISAIQATTTAAAIQTAAAILLARVMETIHPDQAPVPGLVLVPMADRDLDQTAMTIITAASRRS